jgi:hypothetical protein
VVVTHGLLLALWWSLSLPVVVNHYFILSGRESDTEILKKLIAQIVKNSNVDRYWLEQFIESTGYINLLNICDDFFPENSSNLLPTLENSHQTDNLNLYSNFTIHQNVDWAYFDFKFKGIKKELRLLTTWIPDSSPWWQKMIDSAQNGISVQILVLDPKSEMVKQRLRDVLYHASPNETLS